MDYVPPTGSLDPNAPYVSKNTAAGTQGSKVPPKAIEHPMRELKALIEGAGLIPSGSDLQQVLKAVKALIGGAAPPKALLHIGTATGSGGAFAVASLYPAVEALEEGMLIELIFPTPNVGATTVTFTGFEPDITRSVCRADGSDLKDNDVLAGAFLVAVRADGRLGLVNFNPARFAASGTLIVRTSQNWVVPAGVFEIKTLQIWGAGGGGGGAGGAADGNGNWSSAGTGGGGGGYKELTAIKVVPGTTIALTVGTGGAPGAQGGGNGGAGGTTSVGTLAAATGGAGGEGRASGFGNTVAFGGNGIGSDGFNVPGLFGSFPYSLAGALFGGAGGSSYLGTAPAGGYGPYPGADASAPGCGGSGASSNAVGGRGADGLIKLTF
ncbi:hypothetical protein [Methylobacterium nodulans]|uniref:Glycine-rich domain-containing protein n=1 Tax=Methylobacterium nodulans (strain LMG 21967 / CNCM I-2342 / ORS 2060) TaxID=460265 RepID=B8ICK1_METNO|nr:hypothetical protein [Methylobacterium nodulans]ACL57412.1 hypothetical protein Mnod_2442 [Methylobacterium nodulans ORS 2060]